MARVVSLLLGVLVAVVFQPSARAAGGTLLVMPAGEQDPGLQREIARELAQQGISVDEFLTVARLERRVALIGVQPDVLRAACLERIELASWQRDARRVEMLVQTFRGRQALDLVERLEGQLVCLDGVVSRRGLRELAIHRILAMSLDGAGLMELEQAVSAMRSLGEDLLAPTGLPPEIQSLIMESESRRDPIRVFGGGEGFEIFVDGESLLSGAILRGQGKHLVQLVDGRTGRVSTAQWVELDRGPVLIWGGEIARQSIAEEVRFLVEQGVPSPLLRTLTTVLRNTLLVVDRSFRGFRVLHVDGRLLLDSTSRNSRSAPEPVAEATERPTRRPEAAQGMTDSGGALLRGTELRRQMERRFVAGAGVCASFLAIEGRSAAEAGVLVWGRLWGTGDWGGTLSLGLAQQPKLLDPAEEEFYDRQFHLPIRLGGAWSPEFSPLQPEVSVHVLGKLGHDEVDRLGAGLAVGVLAPVWGLNGLRMRAYSEFGGQWWSSGITVGTEWSLGVEN